MTDPNHLPSAADIEKLLPTFDELTSSIPSAADMEKKYVHKQEAPPAAAARAGGGDVAPASSPVAGEKDSQSDSIPAAAGDGSHQSGASPNTALWPDCDTAEDIINEEKYGTEDDPTPAPTPQQVTLAWKALLWGTLWALLGTVASSCLIAYYFGFHSWSELTAHVATKHERDLLVAKEKGFEEDQTNDVYHFVLDLTNPADLPRQVDSIMTTVRELAAFQEQQDALTDAADASKGPKKKGWNQ